MEDDWKPPTDAELKIIQAKRERSDKISKVLADYLLKGYRMLGSVCDVCETVLLQDKQKRDYCVACSEVDSEHPKDNPVLCDEAARKQMAETKFCENIIEVDGHESSQSSGFISHDDGGDRDDQDAGTEIDVSNVLSQIPEERSVAHETEDASGDLAEAICAMQEKIVWASRRMKKNGSYDGTVRWCNLLKTCAETLIVLKQAHGVKFQ